MSKNPDVVADDVVVSLEYTLTVDGEVVDSTEGDDPIEFLQGHENIIPGLEQQLYGLKVGDKTYKLELIQMDTRGEPREATVQFRKMMEDNVKFVFGPFLTNVYNAIEPIANQNNGKFLLFAGATSAHHALGKPDHDYLLRTWNWDAGSVGFGKLMVDYLKKLNTKKVAMLFQNDAFGKTAVDIYSNQANSPLTGESLITLRCRVYGPHSDAIYPRAPEQRLDGLRRRRMNGLQPPSPSATRSRP